MAVHIHIYESEGQIQQPKQPIQRPAPQQPGADMNKVLTQMKARADAAGQILQEIHDVVHRTGEKPSTPANKIREVKRILADAGFAD